MIFGGEQSFYTQIKNWIKKYVCMIFFCGGGATWGLQEFVGGHMPPRLPPPPPPIATPLDQSGRQI